MSEPVRIALVAEGVTDYEVINAIIASVLSDRPFVLRLLQPEESVAFTGAGAAGELGGGWKGVYRWTQLLRERAGKLRDDAPLFVGHDLFVLHLDADVAGEDPAKDKIRPYPELAGALPCEEPCPPASATTDRLRQVMIEWLGEVALPPNAVLCTPSKSMEAWVVPICCPADREAAKANWECRANPENRLGQQPKHERFSKRQADYQARHDSLKAGWGAIASRLSEAERFQREFVAAAGAIPV
jgi:hypothetical protein